jgi:hypothetical protein
MSTIRFSALFTQLDEASISSSISESISPSASISPSISQSISPSVSVSISPSASPSGGLIEGTTCWGHSTGVEEENIRTFVNNWTGIGTIENSGDNERIVLADGEYMESEVINIATELVQILQNKYLSGDNGLIKYKNGTTEENCLADSWNIYSDPFISLGYVKIRVEFI